MKRLAARIQRVRKDLSAIRQELTSGAAWESSDAKPRPPATPAVDLATLQAFKGSIDEMRHYLWWLLQEIALSSGDTSDESLQNFRLHRAAEMLRSLRAQMVETTAVKDDAEVRSFVDALQSLATVVVDRHMSETPQNATHLEEVNQK